tara:strand:+ start:273 stop:410 length:138 start_codon:yes stop_codon:yes gene_type:complete
MSQASPKQKYLQLKDWLSTFVKSTSKTNKPQQQSRLNYYKSKNNN